MKILFLSAIMLFLSGQIFASNLISKNLNKQIPDSIMKIFNRSCACCHSKDGNFFAKMKVNFSKWDKYSENKAKSKAQKICDEIISNSMPPQSWRKNNEKLDITKKEIEIVCKWSNSFK